MILTGKAAEVAENFEKLCEEDGIDLYPELTEEENLALYRIITFFKVDQVYRHYIIGTDLLYRERAEKGGESLRQLLNDLLKLA